MLRFLILLGILLTLIAPVQAQTTWRYALSGGQAQSGSVALTKDSPSLNILTAATVALPPASSCPGKPFVFNATSSTTNTINANGTDMMQLTSGLVSFTTLTQAGTALGIQSNGSEWVEFLPGVASGGGSGTVTQFTAPTGNWPTWLVPSVANGTTTPILSVAAGTITGGPTWLGTTGSSGTLSVNSGSSFPIALLAQAGATTGQGIVYNSGWGVGNIGIPFGGNGTDGAGANPTLNSGQTYNFTTCGITGSSQQFPASAVINCTQTFTQGSGLWIQTDEQGQMFVGSQGIPTTGVGGYGGGFGGIGGPVACGGGGAPSCQTVGGVGMGGGYPSGATGPSISGGMWGQLGGGGAGGGDGTHVGGLGGNSGVKLTILAVGAITINGTLSDTGWNGEVGSSSSTTGVGGGGGGNGGIVTLASQTSVNLTSGQIVLTGGAGANAVGTNAGGGGPGAAGVLLCYSPSNTIPNGTWSMLGGVPGTSNGTFGPPAFGLGNGQPISIIGKPSINVISQLHKDLPVFMVLTGWRSLMAEKPIEMMGRSAIEAVCSLDAKSQKDFDSLCLEDEDSEGSTIGSSTTVLRIGIGDTANKEVANAA